MVDMKDKKQIKDGVYYNWDSKGRCFVNVPMSNVPIEQWKIWNSECEQMFSGQRWHKVFNDSLKARQYDILVNLIEDGQCVTSKYNSQTEPEQEFQVDVDKQENELGLLNPDDK